MASFYRIGADGLNWSNVGSWSATNGGASNGIAEPTASDDVFFTSSSPATCTVTSTAQCQNFTTSKNGFILTLNGGNLTVNGLFTSTINQSCVLNKTTNEIITITGGITVGENIGGSAKIVLTGGSWTGSNRLLAIDTDLQGNVTFNGDVRFGTTGRTLKYVSGTITVTGSILRLSNCNLDLNGMTLNNLGVVPGATITVVLLSNLTINNTLFSDGVSATFNQTTAETITCNGLTVTGVLTGTAKIILTGGTWSGAGDVGNNLDLQGNITVSGTVSKNTRTLTYVSGTVTTTGSTLQLTGSCTLNTDGVVWNAVNFNAANITYTLTSNLTATGLVRAGQSNGNATVNGSTIFANGGLYTETGRSFNGSTIFYIQGGTWSRQSTTNSLIANPIVIRPLVSDVTISGNVQVQNNVLTYIASTFSVIVTGSTLTVSNTHTFETNSLVFETIVFSSSAAIAAILNSTLRAVNITFASTTNNITFQGTSPFICTNFSATSTQAVTIVFTTGINYEITGSLTCNLSRVGSPVLFESSSAVIKAKLKLAVGATCACLANFTRIDASQGRPIRTFNGVVTNCDNVFSFYDLKTIGVSS